jgi:DNA-binding response OmpR family regulator
MHATVAPTWHIHELAVSEERVMRLSLVEDDAAQAELVAGWLEEAGHTVKVFPRGEPFLRALHQDTFDLAILDWDLPDTTGIELLAGLRKLCGWSIPVLFVTVRDREEDVVQALGAGADDYLSKPVSRPVLLARLAALARRVSAPETADVVEAPPFRLDPATNSVTRDGEVIELTEKEFQLAS